MHEMLQCLFLDDKRSKPFYRTSTLSGGAMLTCSSAFFYAMKKKNRSIHSDGVRKRIETLIARRGLECYGLYWRLIDLLRQNDNKMEFDPELLAWETGGRAADVNCVCQEFGLFRVVGGWLESIELYELNEEESAKSAKARQSVRSRWEKQKNQFVVASLNENRSSSVGVNTENDVSTISLDTNVSKNDTNVSNLDTNVPSTLFLDTNVSNLGTNVVSTLFLDTNVSKNDTNVSKNDLQDNIVYTTSSLLKEEEEEYHGIVYQKRNKEKINKREKKRKELGPECYAFANWFLTLLPKDIAERIKDRDIENWADTYDKLIRIDKRTAAEVKAVVEYGRNGWFAQNFLSPAKLRRLDPNGTPYYTVFYNHMRSRSNGSVTGIEERHNRRAELFGIED